MKKIKQSNVKGYEILGLLGAVLIFGSGIFFIYPNRILKIFSYIFQVVGYTIMIYVFLKIINEIYLNSSWYKPKNKWKYYKIYRRKRVKKTNL